MKPALRLLVLGNDASRTGAPTALLRLMQTLVRDRRIKPVFVLLSDGELRRDYERLGEVVVLGEWRGILERGARAKVEPASKALAAYDAAIGVWIRKRCKRWNIQAVFANSLSTSSLVIKLLPLELPLAFYVHEARRFITRHVSADVIAQLSTGVQSWLAVSSTVASDLSALGIDPGRVRVVHPPVPAPSPLDDKGILALRESLLCIGPSTRVVGACGNPSWIKGSDLFMVIASSLARIAEDGKASSVVSCWIGCDTGTEAGRVMHEDLALAGLDGFVRLRPPLPNAYKVLGCLDVMMSTSREDAFPLVVAEAAAHGRPVVCFDGSGGSRELVDAGGGVSVPYLDTAAFVRAVVELLNDPGRALVLGSAAKDYVLNHCSNSAAGSAVAAALEELVS